MNKISNMRAQATKDKIQRALIYLLKRKPFDQIFVKDICTIACINRSSFYEHYQDINDLMIKTEASFFEKMRTFFNEPPFFTKNAFEKMFEFIKANEDFYSAYFENSDGYMSGRDFRHFKNLLEKNLDAKKEYPNLDYHLAFFAGGLQAICKVWIRTGLQETPREMAELLEKEYKEKSKYFA